MMFLIALIGCAMSLMERFSGAEGKKRLIEEVRHQSTVRGIQEIAIEIVSSSEILEVKAEDDLIVQGGSDNDIYFVISGKFDVFINKRLIAHRTQGHHIGEMSMIDSSSSRSATVRASVDSIVLKMAEDKYSDLANKHPDMWRLMAKDLSTRLRERSKFIKEPNLYPHVFVGTSSEYLKAGEALQSQIASDTVVVKLWTEGIFELSSSGLDSLYQVSQQVDYAVLILGPDDKLESRDNFYSSPRDNLVFELGLFMGAIGPERTIFVAPKENNFKIPSDLDGITHIKVDCNEKSKNIPDDEIKMLGQKILSHLGKFGVK